MKQARREGVLAAESESERERETESEPRKNANEVKVNAVPNQKCQAQPIVG